MASHEVTPNTTSASVLETGNTAPAVAWQEALTADYCIGDAMEKSTPIEVVRQFWRLMATNDFTAVGFLLAPEFVVEWPQSRERIRGAERFAQMNAEYPAHGRWSFTVNRLVGGELEAVSEVTVSDGVITARAISFFEIRQGKIVRLVEFWPESFEASSNRAHLVERM